MAAKSGSTIPLFIFLAIVLLFLPCAALVFLCLRRRQRRRIDEESRKPAIDAVAENMPPWTTPVELGDIQPPPPVATIRPIRSLQTSKNKRSPPVPSATNRTDSPFNDPRKPTIRIAVPKPTGPGKGRSVKGQTTEYLAAGKQSPSPYEDPAHSPISSYTARYNLHAALVMEQSSAVVGTAGERLASLGDAPRVKSQVVKPEHATTAALENAHFPPVPDIDAACDAPRQVPQGWV
ncbi:hypothetical protein AYL99_03279 [Fonsecaea erecta]|uniref:Transmembrane protein n=1 Tax=Fonsecaea erecta TaxID=1367422 RepID=A0A178ZMN7_9EURO|nr:hypothetical protein AYL99_03279 [Fonsecaea erecta]OAP61078.1 hypothetical protein AYL99_03279 [Fonsecaea erecta]